MFIFLAVALFLTSTNALSMTCKSRSTNGKLITMHMSKSVNKSVVRSYSKPEMPTRYFELRTKCPKNCKQKIDCDSKFERAVVDINYARRKFERGYPSYECYADVKDAIAGAGCKENKIKAALCSGPDDLTLEEVIKLYKSAELNNK